jgi:protein TonB
MVKDGVIRTTFLISLSGHLLFLGMPLFNRVSLPEESKEITVHIEIERPPLLPKIEVIGKEKRIKEVVEKEKSPDPEPQIQPEEVVIENSAKEPPKEFVKVVDPSQDEAMLRYQDIVKQRIEEARRYPPWAKRRGIEGKVHLSFVVLGNGTTKDIKIIHSSNSKILDEEAVATVQRANPFPPLPQEIEALSLQMEVSLLYLLE